MLSFGPDTVHFNIFLLRFRKKTILFAEQTYTFKTAKNAPLKSLRVSTKLQGFVTRNAILQFSIKSYYSLFLQHADSNSISFV
jgi:hypothetical protein